MTDGLLLFIGICILNNLRQLVEYYFSQGLTKPLLTIPKAQNIAVAMATTRKIVRNTKEKVERISVEGQQKTTSPIQLQKKRNCWKKS